MTDLSYLMASYHSQLRVALTHHHCHEEVLHRSKSNPYRSSIIKKVKTSKTAKYRGIGTALYLINDSLAPAYAKLTKRTHIQAERQIYGWLFADTTVPDEATRFTKYDYVTKTKVSIDGVAMYQFMPNVWRQFSSRPTIIFYHGGGFTSNSVEAYEATLLQMAKLLNVQIFSPEYRLAPEHPYPACLDDCYSATDHVLRHAAEFKIDLDNYGLVGDSAGADLAIWVAVRLATARKACEHVNSRLPAPKLVCPIYPCVHGFLYDFYPSARAQKANKFLKQNFFSSRSLYLLGMKGHSATLQRMVQKNLHVPNSVKTNDMTLEGAAHLIQVLADAGIPLDESKPVLAPLELVTDEQKSKNKHIQEVQTKYGEFLDKALLTHERAQLLKDAGPSKWLMVTAEHDHARDSAIIVGKRLEAHDIDTEIMVVRKAFHGFFSSSLLLGGFEEKDDTDVMLILNKICKGMDVPEVRTSSLLEVRNEIPSLPELE